MKIKINEREMTVGAEVTISEVWQQQKPEADVIIYNGFPWLPDTQDIPLKEDDEIVLFRKGETPSSEEMEALIVARHGPKVHALVREARIGVAGCGGLGSAVAVALARTGVGELLLVDYDVVEPSNLNRQQYTIDQIGQLKTDALKDNLSHINPYVKVRTENLCLNRINIPRVFAGCDVLAECFDDAGAKRELLLAAYEGLKGTPVVTVSGIAGFGPSNDIQTHRILEKVFLVGDFESAACPGRGLLAPRVAIAAGHQANAILRILLGEEQGG